MFDGSVCGGFLVFHEVFGVTLQCFLVVHSAFVGFFVVLFFT